MGSMGNLTKLKHNSPLFDLYTSKKVGSKNTMKNKALDSPKKRGGEQVGNLKSGEQKWGVVGNE